MEFRAQAIAARAASRQLATFTCDDKDRVLQAMAGALAAAEPELLATNAVDVERARGEGVPEAVIDRLHLDAERVAGMVQGLRDIAALPDPVGDVVRGWRLANGVRVSQVRIPFGVVGIIYENRPNVTADAAGLCLKSGNAALLRGSSSAIESNRVCVAALRAGLAAAGATPDAVALVEGGRAVTNEMMAARGLVDVLIPRGGAGLIGAVVEGAKVPVIETGTGNCHLYVDDSADLDMALRILLNAKTQRPSVCNAVETLLVHRGVAGEFLPRALEALRGVGVTVHGNTEVQAFGDEVVPAQPDEFDAEYLSLDLAVRIVADLSEAITHIHTHTTGHSETIVAESRAATDRFVAEIDAAAVLVNASSRFV